MALSLTALSEAELAKSKIANYEDMDEDYKTNLINLINISTTATNGITPEQKILQMTESIRLLALSLIDFITSIRETIVKTIKEANTQQCHDCKAMKHAQDIEQKAEREKLIAEWKEANGIIDRPIKPIEEEKSWTDVAKHLVLSPGLWIFLVSAAIFPYGIDIVKLILQTFAK